MRGKWLLVALVAGLAVSALSAAPASAAKKKRYYSAPGHTVVYTRDEDGRTRSRIVVTRRSFLDGGTEVLPGERKFTDYATQPFHTPFDVLGKGHDNSQLPLPYNMGIYSVGEPSLW